MPRKYPGSEINHLKCNLGMLFRKLNSWEVWVKSEHGNSGRKDIVEVVPACKHCLDMSDPHLPENWT